jgi:hypothetical protein
MEVIFMEEEVRWKVGRPEEVKEQDLLEGFSGKIGEGEGGLVVGGEPEFIEEGCEVAEVQRLLLDDAGDVTEVLLGTAFAIEFQFVEDDVFWRSEFY